MEETNEVKAQAEAFVEQEEDMEITGDVRISNDVVSTIAGIATEEIDGVACMYSSFAGGIAEKLGAKKSPSRGVRVEMENNSVKIDLYLVVEYGAKVPELAWKVQENVKNNVETMTGMSVEKVNIHIEGISFEKHLADSAMAEVEVIGTEPERVEVIDDSVEE